MKEVHILEAVRSAKEPTMSNIASKLRITTGTLAAIDRLVAKKFVERYQEESDRRKVLIRLTDSAREVLKEHDLFHNEMIDEI